MLISHIKYMHFPKYNELSTYLLMINWNIGNTHQIQPLNIQRLWKNYHPILHSLWRRDGHLPHQQQCYY